MSTIDVRTRHETGIAGMEGQRSSQARMPESQQQREGSAHQNVGESERIVSVAAGSIAALLGLRRRSLPGLLIAATGGAMVYRGLTGHCPTYELLDIDTAHDEDGKTIMGGSVQIAQAFLVNRPAEQLYKFWRNFENLPQIMPHLESVRTFDDGKRSHWVARMQMPGAKQLEWDARITRDEADKLIAWESLPGGDVNNRGQISFTRAWETAARRCACRWNTCHPPVGSGTGSRRWPGAIPNEWCARTCGTSNG